MSALDAGQLNLIEATSFVEGDDEAQAELIKVAGTGTRTPDMAQELMCGQRQAPMLQLASRRGGDRRVVECLPETIDGGLYRDARSREDSESSQKKHHLLRFSQ